MTCIILSILTFHIGIDPISPYFVEMTKSVGIHFTHTNGAFFDYDNDDGPVPG